MDCDGLKKAMVKDLDGSLLGCAGCTVLSQSDYEWGGDSQRGLGNHRIPNQMLEDLENIKVLPDALNRGQY